MARVFGRRSKALKEPHQMPSSPTGPVIVEWSRATQKFPPRFYVYQLLDPRDGLPFYVGKGQRDRAWHHDTAVKRSDLTGNRRKVAKIQEIMQRGGIVEIEVVRCYELESDALDHEFRLIDKLPTLTNLLPGGGGGLLSQADQLRKHKIRLEKMRRLRASERRERERQEFGERCLAYLHMAASEKEYKQIEAWLVDLHGPADGWLPKAHRHAN